MGERSSDRRTSSRHPIEIPIEFSVGRDVLIHATANLSGTGAFFQRAIPYKEGTRATLRILLPGEAAICCDGVVVNIPDRKDFGMGVKFERLAPEDQKRIDAFAAAHGRAGSSTT